MTFLFPNQPCAEGVLADLKASESRSESLHLLRPGGGFYVRGFLTTVIHMCSKVDDPLQFLGVQFRVYRTICSFMEPECGYCRHFEVAHGRPWSPALFLDNTYTLAFQS